MNTKPVNPKTKSQKAEKRQKQNKTKHKFLRAFQVHVMNMWVVQVTGGGAKPLAS